MQLHLTFCLRTAIWKSRHQHLGIIIGIDVGIGIGIAKKFFFLTEFLFLPFEVPYEENIYGEVLFKYPCTPSWSFNRCLEQLFCRNLLALASEERNSTVDVISGVLKTLTTESCILHNCKFLVRNPIRDHFLEIFCKF